MSSTSILYIPHGGGPMPLLEDPGHLDLAGFLSNAGDGLPAPEAIVVISAHWEEQVPTLTSGPAPSLIYDYYGFPPESYEITYPAPGHPVLAREIHTMLRTAGIKAALDDERGFDHGMFVPLKLMYPAADIPCVQLSLAVGLNSDEHIRLGKAMAPLFDRNVLVLGSGMSYHNLGEFLVSDNRAEELNREFHVWLLNTCVRDGLTPEEREARLVDWTSAPHARTCHPREEHLMPLHVCFGLASASGSVTAGREVYSGRVMNRRVTALLWSGS